MPGAREVLRALRERGYSLALLAQAAPSRRERIQTLGLEKEFEKIVLTTEKGENDIETIIKETKADSAQSYVVGDRVRKEIAFGNRCGLVTIWVRQGRFAQELPCRTEEEPRATVSSLIEILDIIR